MTTVANIAHITATGNATGACSATIPMPTQMPKMAMPFHAFSIIISLIHFRNSYNTKECQQPSATSYSFNDIFGLTGVQTVEESKPCPENE